MRQSTSLHVAIIMDGNGRWATRRGLPRAAGHRAGIRAVRPVVEAAPGLGITALTLYAFSADNWKRPEAEVTLLMRLFTHYLRSDTPRLLDNGVPLLRAMPWGLNVTLCAVALVAAGAFLLRRNQLSASPDTPWLALTVGLLGAAFMRRDSEALAQFDVIGLLIALSLGAASLHGERIAALRPVDYLRAGVSTVIG